MGVPQVKFKVVSLHTLTDSRRSNRNKPLLWSIFVQCISSYNTFSASAAAIWLVGWAGEETKNKMI